MVNVLVGLPGSGKTTFVNSGRIQGTVLSSDNIRKKYWSETDQMHNNEVFDIIRRTAAKLLDKGESVIIDATNIKPEWRKWCIDLAHDRGVEANAYVLDVDVAVCLERNKLRSRQVPEDVICKMEKEFIMPTTEEGFDKIIFV